MADVYYMVRWREGKTINVRRMTREQLIAFLTDLLGGEDTMKRRLFDVTYLEVTKQ